MFNNYEYHMNKISYETFHTFKKLNADILFPSSHKKIFNLDRVGLQISNRGSCQIFISIQHQRPFHKILNFSIPVKFAENHILPNILYREQWFCWKTSGGKTKIIFNSRKQLVHSIYESFSQILAYRNPLLYLIDARLLIRCSL